MSVLLDDQMNSLINYLTAKSTWDDLILYHKGTFDVNESRVIDLKLCYNTFKFKEGEYLTQTFIRYKALMNELVNDGIKLLKLEINTGFINGLPKKWLAFCQSLRNTNRVNESELASLFEAEDVVAAACYANILWIRSHLTDHDIIYEKIKNHTLKEDTDFHFILTQYQLAEIFIKNLDKPSFKRLIDELGKRASFVARQVEEEEASSIIKLEDLPKLVSNVQPSFKDLDAPEDDPVIVVDDSDEDEDDEAHTTTNAKTEDTSVLKSSSPSSLPTELKDLPSKFNKLTEETVTSITSQVAELKTLQWELPPEFLYVPSQVEMVQAKLKSLDALPSLLNKVTNALNQFAQPIASNKTRDTNVPSAGQAGTQLADGEKNINQATFCLLFQRKAAKNANLTKQQSKPTPPPTTPIIPPDKGKKALSSKEAEKESTDSDSDDDETYKLGSDEIKPTNEGSSNLEETGHDEEQEIYIEGFKTYDEYKDDWIYEWNKDVPWVDEKPWTDTGVWTEPTPVVYYYKPFNYKTKCSKWPTCSWKDDGYCNGGNLPGAYIVGTSLHYHNYEWYEALEDSKLKEEALWNKDIMDGFVNEDDDDDELLYTMRRFEMIKYSFGQDEEYVAIKEDEYDLTRTSEDACRAYQEIFRMMEEGWMVTRAE
nr:hypothetical protein [Tanacetum cinerariifolium]